METTIGSLLDRLQSLVSKGFLLAGFLPAVVFLSLNLGLVYLNFPATRESIGSFFKLPATDQALYWLATVLISFIVGIAFWSLNPWFQQFLGGDYLPQFLRRYLEKQQSRELTECEKRIGSATDALAGYLEENNRLLPKIIEAREKGDKKGQSQIITPTLKTQLTKVEELRKSWKSIPFKEIETLLTLLLNELKINSIGLTPELDEIQGQFFELFNYGLNTALNAHKRALAERKLRFPQDLSRLGPTRMANLREVNREYGLNYYGLDIEWFWLRLLKIVKADANFAPILEESKTQLDFTVAATVLFGLLTALWLIPSFIFAPVVYLILVGAGIPVVLIFYNISVQNYRTFVEAVRSAVDLNRLELLKLLHIELPADSKQEKETWIRLMTWEFDNTQPIIFNHPAEKV